MPRKKSKKIALVYDAIYPFVVGGAERRFHEMGKRLSKSGFDVHLYGMKLWDGPKVIKKNGMTLHGIAKARPLYTKSGRRSIKQAILFGLASFKVLFEDFDIIDCCGFPYFSLFPVKLASVIKRKTLYATWHEVWGKEYWREYLGVLGVVGYAIERIAVKLPDEIIVVASDGEKKLRSVLGAKQPIHVIANGINHEQLRKMSPSEQESDIIYVGRLVDFKNVDYIIKVVAALKRKGQIVRCSIVGDGPKLDSLWHLAAVLGVHEQITWHGFIESSKEVYELMKASKVFLLPSTREGFGMVAIEANACNLPVVTINTPNNAAIAFIKDGVNGSIVPLRVSALTKATQHWIGSNEKEHHIQVRQFDWDNLVNKLGRVYS